MRLKCPASVVIDSAMYLLTISLQKEQVVLLLNKCRAVGYKAVVIPGVMRVSLSGL